MGFFKKKEEVPELPQLPDYPPVYEDSSKPSKSRKSLPELPKSDFGEGLSQEMVKSEINNTHTNQNVEQLPRNFKLNSPEYPGHSKEEGDLIPSLPKNKKQTPLTREIPMEMSPELPEIHRRSLELPSNAEIRPLTKDTDPIFVRIDKFQDAQKKFNEIKKAVKEIGETQKKIRDAKVKEDIEIDAWVQEIDKVKARLGEIDKDIFDKL